MDNHHFAVFEVFPDGRVLVFTYLRVGQKITAIMDVYNDSGLTDGQRYLDLHLNNKLPIVSLTGNAASAEGE